MTFFFKGEWGAPLEFFPAPLGILRKWYNMLLSTAGIITVVCDGICICKVREVEEKTRLHYQNEDQGSEGRETRETGREDVI